MSGFDDNSRPIECVVNKTGCTMFEGEAMIPLTLILGL